MATGIWMRAVALLGLAAGIPASAESPAVPDPLALVRQMHAALGGAFLDAAAGVQLRGHYEQSGLRGSFRQTVDFKHGRDLFSYDVGVTRGQQATSAQGGWWTDEKGLPNVEDAPESMTDAATQSYVDRNGWAYPDPAVPLHYAGVRADGRDRFDLLRLRPPNGRELTLWIDQQTHRPARVVEHDPVKGDSTIYLSDYRRVQGFWFPFKQRQSTVDPGTETVMTATEVHALGQVPDSVFSLPATTFDDALLLGGRSETHIPFTLRYGQIVVPVSVNGSDPLPFVLDSSGISSLTPATAKRLRLSASGHLPTYGVGERPVEVSLTQVSTLRLGDAQLNAQLFQVLQLPPAVTDLGHDAPLAGLLGYELFRRFQVTIDYQRRELTLALPSPEPPALLSDNQHSSLPAQRLVLKFDGGLPYVLGAVDGVPGYFGVDTGDNSGLTLFGHFYARHRFPVELPGLVSSEEGVGGATATFMTRVATLSLGNLTLERPLTQLSFASAGAFAEDRSAGNLGSLILQNFVVTLDFAFRYLYLQPSVQFGQSMAYNRSGLYLRLDRAGIPVVANVLPGSPAALCGLQAGDQLLQVDQQAQRGRDYYDITALFEQPAGTRLQLEIARHGNRELRTLVLREMLPATVGLQPLTTLPPLRPMS